MPTKLLAKQKGEWAEVCFAAEILRRGWRIARPYGDSSPYDCIVDAAGRLSRVQVKSVSVPDRDPRRNHHAGSSRRTRNSKLKTNNCRFHVTVGAGSNKKRRYSSAQIDIIAVFVVPHREWYLIPLQALRAQVSISLRPSHPTFGRFEKYREAWNQFLGGSWIGDW